jgi:hypothetical protein
MSSRLLACPLCARHVRVSESLCPFCGTAFAATFGRGLAPEPPPRGLSRAALYRRSLAAAGAVAGSALLALGGGAALASACTDNISQPDDAGTFPEFEGGHPMATMYGSPCEEDAEQPELCCGAVTKEIPGDRCYGCVGKVAFSLCVGGAFSCTCTCEFPLGYSLFDPDARALNCGPEDTDAGPGDASHDATSDATTDAPSDAEGGAKLDAQEGG